MATDSAPNYALALLLSAGAGLSTCIGGAVVFWGRKLSRERQRSCLTPLALGMAAGVMIYISFIEMFPESIAEFEKVWTGRGQAYAATTGFFFIGVILASLLDKAVHLVHAGHSCIVARQQRRRNADAERAATIVEMAVVDGEFRHGSELNDTEQRVPGADRSAGQVAAEKAAATSDLVITLPPGTPEEAGTPTPSSTAMLAGASSPAADSTLLPTTFTQPRGTRSVRDSESLRGTDIDSDVDGQALISHSGSSTTSADADSAFHEHMGRIGLLSALAIGLHNLPEGVVTFVSSLSSPQVGAVFAAAIGLHNVFEGIVVAVPIFEATGSAWKAFFFASIAGLAEPIGALIAYGALGGSQHPSPVLFGAVFAIVSGVMTAIALTELLPTARENDPQDRLTSKALFGGMMAMALTLVLFEVQP